MVFLTLLLKLKKVTPSSHLGVTVLTSKKGFTTLTAMMVLVSLMSGLLVSYGLIAAMMNRNELYRREIVLSRNILLSYDSYLFNHFGLLGYDLEKLDFERLKLAQFEEAKFKTLQHQWLPKRTLDTSSELLSQTLTVATFRGVEALITVQADLKNKAGDTETGVTTVKKMSREAVGHPEQDSQLVQKYREKMKRMKQTMKDNGMETDGIDGMNGNEKAAEPSPQDPPEVNNPQVSWQDVQIQRDRAATLSEKTGLVTYVMGVFSDRVQSKAHELALYDLQKRFSPLPKGEVEYILVGSHQNRWNQRVVGGEMFAIRTAVQIKAVASDGPLMARLNEEAVALAAVLPIVPLPALVASLVTAEAAERAQTDMKKLLNGEGVELLAGLPTKVYYDDYLFFLLMAQPEATTLSRMLELMATTYKHDCGTSLTFSKLVVGHQLKAIDKGKVKLQIEDGYTHLGEREASWQANTP